MKINKTYSPAMAKNTYPVGADDYGYGRAMFKNIKMI